ncbi:MAG: (2Fe-2S)-binding protein [Planctomycetota bacterium]|nr:(2Fe-2S)-binding protein [Planctomycetota bacterium]
MADPTSDRTRLSDSAPEADDGVLAARVSRRNFMQSLGVSAAAASVAGSAKALAAGTKAGEPGAMATLGPGAVDIALTVNGTKHSVKVEPCTTLLETLRHHIGLTGSKEICDRGSCGGCSVLIDGKLMVSCMMLAVDAAGSSITTIEGLEKNGALDPLQEAFIRHDALQCGYCTPGFVIASKWLLNTNPNPTLAQIKHAMAGNICRCGTYTNIFNAVLDASGQAPLMDASL